MNIIHYEIIFTMKFFNIHYCKLYLGYILRFVLTIIVRIGCNIYIYIYILVCNNVLFESSLNL